jgi:HTH-type transcriptional regulator/antitoxin HigA
MKAKLIKTKSEYEAALARIDKLMDAKPRTRQGDELELLSLVVHDYEERVFPIDKPDPIAAIRFRMEQQGLTNTDLVPFLGSRSRVSEVLSGRRNLSLKMIRALVSGLRIPAEVLLGEMHHA